MNQWMALGLYCVAGLFVWFAMMILKYQRNTDILSDLLYNLDPDRPSQKREASAEALFAGWVFGWGIVLAMFVVVVVASVTFGLLGVLFSAPAHFAKRLLTPPPSPPPVEQPEPIVLEIGTFREGPIYVEEQEQNDV